MKRVFNVYTFILISFINSFLFLPPNKKVVAETTSKYFLISEDGIILYSFLKNYEFCPLFSIPKTYYVEYISQNSNYYIVRYMDIISDFNLKDLFVLKKSITISAIDLISVENPFPKVQIFLKTGATIYKESSQSGEKLIQSALDYTPSYYYGSISKENKLWHFIKYNEILGYVLDESLLKPLFIPPHPNSVIKTATESNNFLLKGVDTTTLILITGIIVPVLLILVLMFKPRKNKKIYREKINRFDCYMNDPIYKQLFNDQYHNKTNATKLPYDKY